MISFSNLWSNHPTVASIFDDAPCKTNGSKNFPNQCAIRMSVAFDKSGIDTALFDKMFPNRRCWFNHGKGHILAAEEMAAWVEASGMFGHGDVFDGDKGFDRIDGKTGIIFFKDYYGTGNQGDHIDLWNGSRLTHPRSLFRFNMFSDGGEYKKAKVTFWSVA